MNEIIIGTLARAKQRHKVRVCFFVCLGNHMHLLLWTEDARELAQFMGYFLVRSLRGATRFAEVPPGSPR
jgi:REP element-mobilizing transposase RayT